MTTLSLPQIDPREAARERECADRRNGLCLAIGRRVGWDVAVSIDWCDGCAARGMDAPGLDAVSRQIVSAHADPAVRPKLDRDVLETLRDRHGVPVDAAEIAAASDHKQRWREVRLSWKNAAAFAASMTSRIFGSVDEERLKARLRACSDCPARRESKGRSYCGVCGCGETALAALDDKLKHPALRCPLGRFP